MKVRSYSVFRSPIPNVLEISKMKEEIKRETEGRECEVGGVGRRRRRDKRRTRESRRKRRRRKIFRRFGFTPIGCLYFGGVGRDLLFDGYVNETL